MLVLTRKKDDRITLTSPDGTQISVTVVRIGGNVVCLGFEAPPEFIINRKEVNDDMIRTSGGVRSSQRNMRKIQERALRNIRGGDPGPSAGGPGRCPE